MTGSDGVFPANEGVAGEFDKCDSEQDVSNDRAAHSNDSKAKPSPPDSISQKIGRFDRERSKKNVMLSPRGVLLGGGVEEKKEDETKSGVLDEGTLRTKGSSGNLVDRLITRPRQLPAVPTKSLPSIRSAASSDSPLSTSNAFDSYEFVVTKSTDLVELKQACNSQNPLRIRFMKKVY
jgi:hypothetical protein